MGRNKRKRSVFTALLGASGPKFSLVRSVVTLAVFLCFFLLAALALEAAGILPGSPLGSFFGTSAAEEDGWSQSEEEFSSEHYVGHIEMELDSQDNLHYFWEQSLYKGQGADQSLERELVYRKLATDGRVLVIDTRIATTSLLHPLDSTYPQLLIDSQDTVHLIWKEAPEENRATLRYCHLDEYGEAYFQALAFVDDSAFVATMPTATIDREDHVHVAWFDIRYDLYNESKMTAGLSYSMLDGRAVDRNMGHGKPQTHEAATLIDDTKIVELYPPMDVVDPETALDELLAQPMVFFPTIASDADGIIHLAWSDYRDTNAEIYYAALEPGRDDADGDAALRNQIKVQEDKRLSYSGEQSLYPDLVAKHDGSLSLVFVERPSPGQTQLSWKLRCFSLDSGRIVAADTVYESPDSIAFPRITGQSTEHNHVSFVVSASDEDSVLYRKIRIADWKQEMKKTIFRDSGVDYLSTGVDSNDNIYLLWSRNTFSGLPRESTVFKRYYSAKPDFTAPNDSPAMKNINSLTSFVDDYLEERDQEGPGEHDFTQYLHELKQLHKEQENIEIGFTVQNTGNRSGEMHYLSFFSTEKLDQDEFRKLKTISIPSDQDSDSLEVSEREEDALVTRLRYADIPTLVLDIPPQTGTLTLSPDQDFQITLRFRVDVGEYFFYTLLDPLDAIHESREENNVIEHPLTVFNSYPSSLYFSGIDRESEDPFPASYNFSLCVNIIEPSEWLLRYEQNNGMDRTVGPADEGASDHPFSMKARILLNGEEYKTETIHVQSELASMYIIGDKQTEIIKQYIAFELVAEELLEFLQHQEGLTVPLDDGKEEAMGHHLVVMIESLDFESLVCDNFIAGTFYLPLQNDVSVDHLSVQSKDGSSDGEGNLYPGSFLGENSDAHSDPGGNREDDSGKRVFSENEGDTLFASALLTNRGDLALVCEISFFLDEENETNLLARRAVYLLPHSSRNITISFVPEEGTHTLIAIADKRNIILEHNEENNVRTVFLKIRERQEDRPFLEERSPELMMLGSVGIIALLSTILGSEPGKYKFFAFLFPLYTRLKKEEILDQFLRGQIYGYIKAHPGAHYNQLKRNLDVNNGNLSYHLKVLERERFIKSERDGVNRRFYPWGMKVAKDAFHFSDVQRQIVDIIEKNPGMSQKEIAKIAGMSTQVINYHIRILTQAQVLRLGKRGRKTLCYVNSSE